MKIYLKTDRWSAPLSSMDIELILRDRDRQGYERPVGEEATQRAVTQWLEHHLLDDGLAELAEELLSDEEAADFYDY